MGPKSTQTGPRPSDTWTNNAFGPPWETTFLETFITNLDLQALAAHANQLSGRNNATVSTSPYCRGQENIVLEISFDNTEYWVARIQLPPTRPPGPYPGAGYFQESYSYKSGVELRSEVTTMKYVKSHSKVPVPEVYGYCAEENNPVGAMYILMAPAKGKLLDFIPKFPDHVKDHVYSQVASFMLELCNLRWPKIGLL